MGHNDYAVRTKKLLDEGFDFVSNPPRFKNQTKMWKKALESDHAYVCVVTLWDDDSVTETCNKISMQALHAGFV